MLAKYDGKQKFCFALPGTTRGTIPYGFIPNVEKNIPTLFPNNTEYLFGFKCPAVSQFLLLRLELSRDVANSIGSLHQHSFYCYYSIVYIIQ